MVWAWGPCWEGGCTNLISPGLGWLSLTSSKFPDWLPNQEKPTKLSPAWAGRWGHQVVAGSNPIESIMEFSWPFFCRPETLHLVGGNLQQKDGVINNWWRIRVKLKRASLSPTWSNLLLMGGPSIHQQQFQRIYDRNKQGTICMFGRFDNHYTTETIMWKSFSI